MLSTKRPVVSHTWGETAAVFKGWGSAALESPCLAEIFVPVVFPAGLVGRTRDHVLKLVVPLGGDLPRQAELGLHEEKGINKKEKKKRERGPREGRDTKRLSSSSETAATGFPDCCGTGIAFESSCRREGAKSVRGKKRKSSAPRDSTLGCTMR